MNLSPKRRASIASMALLGLSACASTPVTETGALTSYQDMKPVKSLRAQAQIAADGPALAAAKTVAIEPVTYRPGAADSISPEQRKLIANLIARTLCVKLSDKFDIVESPRTADLTVRTFVTRLRPTNREAAAITVPIRATTMAFGIPAPIRVPLGMGAFAAESEAVDPSGTPRAAMVWSRAADMVSNPARVSKIGDAYALSDAFAGDMAALVVTGTNPLHDLPKFVSRRRPVAPACAVYGKSPGAEGFVSGIFGAPPEWTDKPGPVPSPLPGS